MRLACGRVQYVRSKAGYSHPILKPYRVPHPALTGVGAQRSFRGKGKWSVLSRGEQSDDDVVEGWGSTLRSAPMVAIMVINYNGLRWLPRCLSSVQNTEYLNFEVCLIDNASGDDSVKYVRENYPSVKIIQNPRNLGFAEAYNRIIENTDAELVVLLNNDTEILNPLWLDKLVAIINHRPEVGAVACKMVSTNEPSLLESVGTMGVRFWRGFADIGWGERDVGQYSVSFEPFGFCGGAALVRRDAFLKAGEFDEKFFVYAEDVDLSWRLRLLGWKIGYCPDAVVAHVRGASAWGAMLTGPRIYYGLRNVLRAILKNCGSSLGWALRNFAIFATFAFFGFAAFEPRTAYAPLRAAIWNLRHLGDTLRYRHVVQRSRKTAESEILRAMYPFLQRHDDGYMGHDTARALVTNLLDRGQSKSFYKRAWSRANS